MSRHEFELKTNDQIVEMRKAGLMTAAGLAATSAAASGEALTVRELKARVAAAAAADAAAEETVKRAGLRLPESEERAFCACLDYVFFRNPPAAPTAGGGGGVKRTCLRAVGVAELPTVEAAAAACGALPSREHPSDHIPIAADFELDIDEA